MDWVVWPFPVVHVIVVGNVAKVELKIIQSLRGEAIASLCFRNSRVKSLILLLLFATRYNVLPRAVRIMKNAGGGKVGIGFGL